MVDSNHAQGLFALAGFAQAEVSRRLVFDSHLMHCSTDNVSNGIRADMVYYCCAAGTAEHDFKQFDGFKDPTRRLDPLISDGQLMT